MSRMQVRKPTNYDVRVFINCPFDDLYLPIFQSILFTIHDLGFIARHALIDNAKANRLERITEEIATSRYSIHDISRVEIAASTSLPRFNMPFECGIAYSVHLMQPYKWEHDFCVLEAVAYQAQVTTSDLAGIDPKVHENKPEMAIQCVREFIKRKSGNDLPGAKHIQKRYADFFAHLPKAAAAANIELSELTSLSYLNDLQSIMAKWIIANPP